MATLINNIDVLKANIGAIDANFIWASISSYVEDVERDIISELIGDDQLQYFLDNPTGLEGNEDKALQLLCRAEAYLTILKWSQFALFRLTDRALYIAATKDGVIPSDKKLNDLRRTCEETGFNYLDKAITLMENNPGDFNDYANSDMRQTVLKGFIKTASDFNDQRGINNSRTTFVSMLAIMHDVQDEYLPGVMGEDYYNMIKLKYQAGQLNVEELKLLPLIKKAVAFLTIARACNELPVKVTDRGLLINKYNDTREYEQGDPAEAARVQFLSEDTMEKGQRKLVDLKLYLIKNPTRYPEFIPPAHVDISPNCRRSGTYLF